MSEPGEVRRYDRLMCRHCATITQRAGKSYEIAVDVASMSNPPDRVTIAWRCEGCRRMNRQGESVQAVLI